MREMLLGGLTIAGLAMSQWAGATTLLPCPKCINMPVTALGRAKPKTMLHRALLGPGYGDLFSRKSTTASPNEHIAQKSLSVGDDFSGFSLRAERQYVRRRSPAEDRLMSRDRVSTTMFGARYDISPIGDNRFAAIVDGGVQRRRLGSDIGDGHWSTSSSLRVGVEWVHDDIWRLSGGYAVTLASNNLSPERRGIELAHGASASRSGARLALDFSPTGFGQDTPFRIGVQAGTNRLSARDAIAYGANSRTDARLVLALGWKF